MAWLIRVLGSYSSVLLYDINQVVFSKEENVNLTFKYCALIIKRLVANWFLFLFSMYTLHRYKHQCVRPQSSNAWRNHFVLCIVHVGSDCILVESIFIVSWCVVSLLYFVECFYFAWLRWFVNLVIVTVIFESESLIQIPASFVCMYVFRWSCCAKDVS